MEKMTNYPWLSAVNVFFYLLVEKQALWSAGPVKAFKALDAPCLLAAVTLSPPAANLAWKQNTNKGFRNCRVFDLSTSSSFSSINVSGVWIRYLEKKVAGINDMQPFKTLLTNPTKWHITELLHCVNHKYLVGGQSKIKLIKIKKQQQKKTLKSLFKSLFLLGIISKQPNSRNSGSAGFCCCFPFLSCQGQVACCDNDWCCWGS